ncbi:hypothetical protein SEA_ASEGATO_20 [Microbacterium phage ASegato]|nr:hypothetical protein SEA_ASEGATO_20 [Microbacterium phage ASegato]
MFGKRKKKDLVEVQVVLTVDMATLNELRNRITALASSYIAAGDLGITVATAVDPKDQGW